MYEMGKALLLRLLRVPHEPEPPAGSAASLRVFRAAPKYLRYRLIIWAIAQAWLVVVALFVFFSIQGGLSSPEVPHFVRVVVGVLETFGWVALVGSIVISYLTLRLDFEMRYYMVTDRSLRIREGVWGVHEMTMTFANIQNITIEQGPLQRFFGIADLKVQSAGGGGMGQAQAGGRHGAVRDLHVGWFRGVDDAPAIRDLVLRRLRELRDAGLGDHEDSARPVRSGLVPVLQELATEMRGLRSAAERRSQRA